MITYNSGIYVRQIIIKRIVTFRFFLNSFITYQVKYYSQVKYKNWTLTALREEDFEAIIVAYSITNKVALHLLWNSF
jgi:hypothetical protein